MQCEELSKGSLAAYEKEQMEVITTRCVLLVSCIVAHARDLEARLNCLSWTVLCLPTRFARLAASDFHDLTHKLHSVPTFSMARKTANEKAAVLQYLAMIAPDILVLSSVGKVLLVPVVMLRL